ncbi:MAG: garK, partial [Akkermansiaceae bacterium]|nr:garK [Akkermansiaceae bacterium]
MRVVIACDKFKGSLGAEEACEAVRQGLPEAWAADLCPIADGGEGFVASMLSNGGGEVLTVACADALGRPVFADYGLRGATAFIEMAAASGLWRIDPAERDLLRS